MKRILPLLFVCQLSFSWAWEPTLGTEEQRAASRQLYIRKCDQCHGEDGDGAGVAAPYFQPPPRDFQSGSYKIRTTESGELPTDADLKQIIKRGLPYTGMPLWPNLSDEQIENLVYYTKTFYEDFADPDYIVPPLDMPAAPAYTEESAKSGRAVFEKNQCVDCHGQLGRGNGESAPTLMDDAGNPIRPTDLTKPGPFVAGRRAKTSTGPLRPV